MCHIYIFFLFIGAERNTAEVENDAILPRTSILSHGGSSNSLNSGNSVLVVNYSSDTLDSPQQFEVLKHQKEIWETGITL